MEHYNNKIAAGNSGGPIFVERDGKIELAGLRKPMEHYDTMFAGASGGPVYVLKEGKLTFAGLTTQPFISQPQRDY